MKSSRGAAFLVFILISTGIVQAQGAAKSTRTEDTVYGRKFGTALTMDVFTPEKTNGAAILWVVSGGFYSSHATIRPDYFNVFLERGYIVCAVVHSSLPRFIIPEIEEDIHRAVRFVRHRAGAWGINPDKLGICGTSSGGYLSLIAAVKGGAGESAATDQVDRESSRVEAVACFCPPTDFLNWSKAGEVAPQDIAPAFWQRGTSTESQQKWGEEISPIYFVRADLPPTLIIQGDADQSVPLYQAQLFEKKCREVGAVFQLVVKPGAGHGYPGWQKDVVLLADWFDRHLLNL